MSIRPVRDISSARPTIEGAGVRLHRAFGFGDPEIPMTIPWGIYGWLIWAEAEPAGFPEDLQRCMDYAKAHGCAYLRLDCDGDHEEELPRFEW